eukprot:COSAG01_NODE_18332_length_1084_cov_1.140102_1_plen_76_part_00
MIAGVGAGGSNDVRAPPRHQRGGAAGAGAGGATEEVVELMTQSIALRRIAVAADQTPRSVTSPARQWLAMRGGSP